jgi:hypothetical protein
MGLLPPRSRFSGPSCTWPGLLQQFQADLNKAGFRSPESEAHLQDVIYLWFVHLVALSRFSASICIDDAEPTEYT